MAAKRAGAEDEPFGRLSVAVRFQDSEESTGPRDSDLKPRPTTEKPQGPAKLLRAPWATNESDRSQGETWLRSQ